MARAVFGGQFAGERCCNHRNDAVFVGVGHESQVAEVYAQNGDTAVFDLSSGAQNGAVAAQHYGKIEVVDIFDAALEKLG